MSAESAKDASDLSSGAFGIARAVLEKRRSRQTFSNVSIAESTQTVIAIHDALEEFSVSPCKWIQRSATAAGGICLTSRNAIKVALRLGWIDDNGERFQITRVGL